MRRYWAYFKYVVRHKWFVLLWARRLGVPLHRAVLHDWHKFLPREFFPYAHAFYNADGSKRVRRDSSGAYNPTKIGAEFDYAWLSHQKAKHHWQSWIMLGDGGSMRPLPIPATYLREMVADWCGAGQAQGSLNPKAWYTHNKDNLVLAPESRERLEYFLGLAQMMVEARS